MNNETRAFHIVIEDHRYDRISSEFCYIHPRAYALPFDLELELLQMSFVAEHCPDYRNGYYGEPDCSYSAIQQAHDARREEMRVR